MSSKSMTKIAGLSPVKRELLASLLREKGIASTSRIGRRDRSGAPPLSFAQQRLWLLHQFDPLSTVYNLSRAIRLNGALDLTALDRALNEIVERHEVLRTTFAKVEDEPIQIVHKLDPFTIEPIDLSGRTEDEREELVRELTAEEARKPFDLERGPVLRVVVIRLGPNDHLAVVTMHHIVCDGWSARIFFSELAALYEAYSSGVQHRLPELALQYADFACWQRDYLQGDRLEAELSYWRNHLGGELPVLQLPTDRPRPPVHTFSSEDQCADLSKDLSESLKSLSRREGVTLFMVLLAAFNTLLHRYSGQDDILIGTPNANRNRAETEGLIGFFINALVLRTDLSGDPSYRQLLSRVREVTLGAYAHQDLPFDMLVMTLQPERNLSHMPLFQVAFNLQKFERNEVEFSGLGLGLENLTSGTMPYDLNLNVADTDEGLVLSFGFNTDLFDRATITRMTRHFQVLLDSIVSDPDLPISKLPLIDEDERGRMIVEWNNTRSELPARLSLNQLFHDQAERTPDGTAVSFGEEELSYGELQRRAGALAGYLERFGVGPDAPVGICFERSIEMIVVVLAIVKAGGAYVPLDPSYPRERLAFMIEDSGASVIVTHEAARTAVEGLSSAAVIDIDAWREAGLNEDGTDRYGRAGAGPDNLAYVIYTSGSTGRPKGVMISHRAICNRLLWMRNAFAPGQSDAILQKTSFSFDASVWEIFLPLISGARLVLAKPEGHRDSAYMVKLIGEQDVTVVQMVPSMLQVFLEEPELERCHALKDLFCGGEALPASLERRFFSRLGAQLHNLYGPTEASIDATYHQCEGTSTRSTVSIGRPLSNVQIYLLDSNLNPLPLGLAGELYIGGAGLARGYLGRPDLTAERFTPDPFGPDVGRRLYRTGDLARYSTDGTIDFLGRTDHQVKIRGFRIECGEIEAVLEGHPSIREAVVLAREDQPGEPRLVAYLVTNQPEPRTANIKDYLKSRLPDYMTPSIFMMIEAVPLLPNGKINLQGLPMPDRMPLDLEEAFVAAGTPIQEMLEGIWSEVLGVERVGPRDNFFELGGHSLLALQVGSRIRKLLNIDLTVRKMFEAPTIEDMAEAIEAALRSDVDEAAPPLVRVDRDGYLPLSFAQRRLWFFDQFEPNSIVYNLPGAVRLMGSLDEVALNRTVGELVKRHETLRTTFAALDGQPIQVIAEPAGVTLPVIDLIHVEDERREAEVTRLATEEATRAFDLARGPLFRTVLLRLNDWEHVLLFTIHHIISDAWSGGVLIREMVTLYDAFSSGEVSPLPDLPIQYVDYACWQQEWLRGKVLETQLTYWDRKLRGGATLSLPTDRPHPHTQTYNGGHCPIAISKEATEGVLILSRKEGSTPFITLAAVFKALLQRYTGQEDISIGTPIAGRRLSETEALIGLFVNTLVLRSEFTEDLTFKQLLGRVRETALGAYVHQDVPFEMLVEELQPERALSHSPLFQVMFAFQNTPSRALKLPGLTLSQQGIENNTAKFELTLMLEERAEGLRGWLQYNTDLFDPETGARMAGHFAALVESAGAQPGIPLSDLALLRAEERNQILVEWNRTEKRYRDDVSIQQLFDEQVERSPHSTALVFQRELLSYLELQRRSNRLAHFLISRGAGPETLVGVCMERSLEMVVALMGVLKAGAAYVPLDPEYPPSRLAFMVQDSQAPILLTQERFLNIIPQNEATTVCVDRDWEAVEAFDANTPSTRVVPANMAYMIYTSGSTGRPKGAVNSHSGICNYLQWLQDAYQLSETDTVIQKTPYSFDVSVWEFFWPLITGARLAIARPGGHQDNSYMLDLAAEQGITVAHFVPPQLQVFLEEPGIKTSGTLRLVICSGEALPLELQDRFHSLLKADLVNLYGPTEAAVDVTYWNCRRDDPRRVVPIGRPVANTKTYIVDRWLNPVPVGVLGELLLGGFNLGRGYHERAELTAEKFMPDPFGAAAGKRLYRTGDLTRYLTDGSIDFLGRLDHQVKIRGFRIELAEIEAAIAQFAGVQDAVVIAREDTPGEKELVGYFVCDSDDAVTLDALREFIRARLPEYMTPAALVRLEALPLTPNEKVDRRALPAPDRSLLRAGLAYIAPRSPVEEILAQVFSDLLKIVQPGTRDNFFDLGGHSLLATQVVSRIRDAFRVELPLRTVFEQPTIAELAEAVEKAMSGNRGLGAPPIEPTVSNDGAPLSFAQQRLWFIDQLEPGSALYNISGNTRLRGFLDPRVLEESFNELFRRHESLRTTFPAIDGRPVQVVNPPTPIAFPIVDLTALDRAKRETAAQELATAEAGRSFDLACDPMLRVGLIRLEETDHVLLMTIHHIASDGWSLGVMVREVAALYEDYRNGRSSSLPELTIQYADFARWQRSWLQGEVLDTQLSYWKQQLAGAPLALDLPTDKLRPARPAMRGSRRNLQVDSSLLERLKTLSRQESTTLFMTLLSAFATLLYRYSGEEDIVVGTPIANRNRGEIEGLIGFFANTLVMRTDLGDDPSFRELMSRTRGTALGAYAHQDLPFEFLVEQIRPERQLSVNPLFQVLLVLQNAEAASIEGSEMTFSPMAADTGTAKFDLTLMLAEVNGGLAGYLEYSTDLFVGSTIERMLRHFRNILEGAAADPDRSVSSMPLIDEPERRELLVDWNSTYRAYRGGLTIQDRFDTQVLRTPEAVAVVSGDESLSYRELNARANRQAHYLRSLGVGPEMLVAISLGRSLDLATGVLGIIKSGAAYVPLDSSYPADRLSYVLDDGRPSVLLTQSDIARTLPEHGARILCLESIRDQIDKYSNRNPENLSTPESLAYVIYTSGSTGRPKGIAMSHGAFFNVVSWLLETFKDVDGSKTLQFAPISFDTSNLELFSTWCAGGTVVMISDEERRDPASLLRFLAGNSIHRLFLPFVAFKQLCEIEEVEDVGSLGLAHVITAGEQLQISRAVSGFFDRAGGCLLHNHYGPSECHVVTAQTLGGSPADWPSLPSVGFPISNTQIYLLDKMLEPVPIGVAGELYIGGISLARGYLNGPELSADRFVPDAFSKTEGSRLYKTGDLARRLADGQIEFLGRNDSQVKVRGYRVELGEVEAVLSLHPEVRQGVVVARESERFGVRIVAYVCCRDSCAASAMASSTELRGFLSGYLPEYMLPAEFVFLDALPLMPSGKVDRKALPEPAAIALGNRQHISPRTPIEEVLAGIWSEVLSVEKVGALDNFFHLGGHSLLATQVVSRIRRIFGVALPLRRIFEAPTLAELAERIESADRGDGSFGRERSIQPVLRGTVYPLSYAQEYSMVQAEREGRPSYYSRGVQFTGPLDIAVLEKSLTEIVRRQESLRMTFPVVDGRRMQMIHAALRFNLPVVDLSAVAEQDREPLVECVIKQVEQDPLDLAGGPLFKVTAVKMAEEDHLILYWLAHIVCDRWSLNILAREISSLYGAFSRGESSPLRELDVQYVDFAQWQREWMRGKVLETHLGYWKGHLDGSPDQLRLPVDRPRPTVQTFRGATIIRPLPLDLSNEIRSLSRLENNTTFITTLAVFKVLLRQYTGSDDILVGTAIGGHNQVDVETVIGNFINPLVMRTKVDGEITFLELVARVRATALRTYTWQEMPFWRLVEELRPVRDPSYTPLIQVGFVIHHEEARPLELPGLGIRLRAMDTGRVPFELTLSIHDTRRELHASINYNLDLFDRGRINSMLDHYETLLARVVQEPDVRIAELPAPESTRLS